jgi:hypothetical protein
MSLYLEDFSVTDLSNVEFWEFRFEDVSGNEVQVTSFDTKRGKPPAHRTVETGSGILVLIDDLASEKSVL